MKKILGPEKIFGLKNFGMEKFLGPKHIVEKNLGPEKILGIKKFCHGKKILVQKYFRFEKNLGSNRIAGPEIFSHKHFKV